MASAKVKFRPSTVAGQESRIYLQERKPRQLATDYKIFPFDWNENRGQVVTQNDSPHQSLILSIRKRVRWDEDWLNKIKRHFSSQRIGLFSNSRV